MIRKIAGNRRPKRDDTGRLFIDLLFQLINDLISETHLFSEFEIPLFKAFRAVEDRSLDQSTCLDEEGLKGIEVPIKDRRDVVDVHTLDLADPTGNIAFGPVVLRVGEDLVGIVVLNKVAKVEERRLLADPARLLHRVRDDDNRVVIAQLVNQFFNLRSCDRVKRRAGFVHQQNFGFRRNGPGDAQTLLLAPRQAGAGRMQPVLDLVPDGSAAQSLFHDLVHVRLGLGQPVNPGAIGDVVVDRLGEWVRLLEHHADLGAQLHGVDAVVIDILPVDGLIVPSTRQMSMVSFIRFRQRRKVDLPQPDGPMNAVTVWGSISTSTDLIAWVSP